MKGNVFSFCKMNLFNTVLNHFFMIRDNSIQKSKRHKTKQNLKKNAWELTQILM